MWRISSRSIIVSLIVVMFLISTGGSLNPAKWPEQFGRRVNPSSLLDIDEGDLRALEDEFIFFKKSIDDGMSPPCLRSEMTIFHEIYCFISGKVAYENDTSLYYSLDYLAKPAEVLSKGADDCDGKAVLICTMLLKRGYDAYVVMGTEHTWVEVRYLDRFVYISYLGSNDPVVITDEPLPAVRSTYAIFNTSDVDWKPLGLMLQGAMIFFYMFFVLFLAQAIYVYRLHEVPIHYISEIFGYFKYILYMIMMIFLIWVFILLLVNYLFTIQ